MEGMDGPCSEQDEQASRSGLRGYAWSAQMKTRCVGLVCWLGVGCNMTWSKALASDWTNMAYMLHVHGDWGWQYRDRRHGWALCKGLCLVLCVLAWQQGSAIKCMVGIVFGTMS